jgi:predicted  nucleic acid-binding Zn-ribbon protein
MAFSDKDINLGRYECARCRRTPEIAREIFQGCICGHRFFRIKPQNENSLSNIDIKEKSQPTADMEFLTIREREIGIYDINVENIMGKKLNKSPSPLIAGSKGVYSIRLENSKK